MKMSKRILIPVFISALIFGSLNAFTQKPANAPKGPLGGAYMERLSKLNLTDAQKKSIEDALADFKAKVKAIRTSSDTAEVKKDKVKELSIQLRTAVQNVLTLEQKQQLKNQNKNTKKFGASGMDKWSALNLSDIQRMQIDKIELSLDEQTKLIRTNDKLTPLQKRTQLRDLKKSTDEAIQQVLTLEQKQKLIEIEKRDEERKRNQRFRSPQAVPTTPSVTK